MDPNQEYIKFKNYEEVIIPVNEIDHDQHRLLPLVKATERDVALFGTFYLSRNHYNNGTKVGYKLTNPLEHTVEYDMEGVVI